VSLRTSPWPPGQTRGLGLGFGSQVLGLDNQILDVSSDSGFSFAFFLYVTVFSEQRFR